MEIPCYLNGSRLNGFVTSGKELAMRVWLRRPGSELVDCRRTARTDLEGYLMLSPLLRCLLLQRLPKNKFPVVMISLGMRRDMQEELDIKMEGHSSIDISSAKAVLMGALASGVNGPTWFVLKITFLLLAVCLTAMLALAFSSSDFIIVGHVLLLVAIGAVLFVLLNGFLAQTGLVSVEQQMEEMGILSTEAMKKDKRN